MSANVSGNDGKRTAQPTGLFVDHDKHWSTGGVIRALQVLKEDEEFWGKTVSRYRKK
jgi:hypothetical protein